MSEAIELQEAFQQILDEFSAAIVRIGEAIQRAIKPLIDWICSPQTRRWLKVVCKLMRRRRIVAPRRKAISTKRAMIYQRKRARSYL